MTRPPDRVRTFYKSLYLIRRTEERIIDLYPTDKIKSPVHLSIGQESVAVGACQALEAADVVFATYRSHAVYLARGGDLKEFWAELYGKVTGCARGKAGSMHMIDPRVNMTGTSAIVGTSIPHSVGYAWALQQQGKKAVVLSVFGDGATDEGAFYEGLNFAALKKAPVIFLLENNNYAIYTPPHVRSASATYCDRAAVHRIPTRTIPDSDPFEVYEAIREARRNILEQGTGPVFIETITCRWRDHVGPGDDFSLGYRTEADLAPWKDKDHVRLVGEMLKPADRKAVEAEAEAELAAAIQFAEDSPFPADHELYEHILHD